VPSSTYAPIGKMSEWVTIQVATATDDGMGGTSVTWPEEAWKKTPASVLPLTLSERERLASMHITALQSYRVVMRYRPTLTVKDRLSWRDKTLQIHTVTDDVSAKRRTVLECTEVQN
jgi:SPP1 family predicted phage head-tail adaptor